MKKSMIYIVMSFVLLTACSGNQSGINVRQILGWDVVALENVELTSQWQQFVLNEPFKTGGSDERTFLEMKVENPRNWTVNPYEYRATQSAEYWRTHVPNYVLNPQGQQTDIEMELITEDGRIFELYPFTVWDEGIRFEYKHYPGVGVDVPYNKIFTKIKIKSSNSFKCQRLIWSRYYRK